MIIDQRVATGFHSFAYCDQTVATVATMDHQLYIRPGPKTTKGGENALHFGPSRGPPKRHMSSSKNKNKRQNWDAGGVRAHNNVDSQEGTRGPRNAPQHEQKVCPPLEGQTKNLSRKIDCHFAPGFCFMGYSDPLKM